MRGGLLDGNVVRVACDTGKMWAVDRGMSILPAATAADVT